MANPNKMGMSDKERARSHAARFPNPTFYSDPAFQQILVDLQNGRIDAQEAERRIRSLNEGKKD